MPAARYPHCRPQFPFLLAVSVLRAIIHHSFIYSSIYILIHPATTLFITYFPHVPRHKHKLRGSPNPAQGIIPVIWMPPGELKVILFPFFSFSRNLTGQKKLHQRILNQTPPLPLPRIPPFPQVLRPWHPSITRRIPHNASQTRRYSATFQGAVRCGAVLRSRPEGLKWGGGVEKLTTTRIRLSPAGIFFTLE
ncbi:hypothetical protein HOY82DRAFT_261118 [Tuber indicum]|nr:hypothetical protein HOY82DRAFT_261118 [Tuber indicum]